MGCSLLVHQQEQIHQQYILLIAQSKHLIREQRIISQSPVGGFPVDILVSFMIIDFNNIIDLIIRLIINNKLSL